MRSRYAAFAVKDAEYLWRTLHPDHDDRAHPKEAAVRAIRQVCSENRYMGLEILDHHAADEHGVARVLFFAKVFTRGRDLSFVECSEFLNDGEGWRYLTGTLILTSEIKGERSSLTIAEILKR